MGRIVPTLVLVLLPGVASAQNPVRPDTVFPLPGITVTAARTPLRVLDVPLAVTVIGSDQLANRNGLRLDQAFFGVPGVLAQSRYGGTDIRIVIRGFGARGAGDRSNAGTTRGVRILQDGFPETEPDGRSALDLIDLGVTQSLEVVRSNASALWGNAAGGLINFSNVPAFAERAASFEHSVGSFGLTRDMARVSTPLADGQIYGSAVMSQFDGYRANSNGERKLVNFGLAANPGGHTQIRASAVAADNRFSIPGPLTLAQLEANPERANATYLARLERRRNRVGRRGIAVDHSISETTGLSGMVFINPKYLQRSERGTFRDFNRYHVGGNAVFRTAMNFTSDVRGSLSVGVDEAYQDGAILFYGLTSAGERATDLRDNKREGANNFGVFAQELITFSPRIDVSVGARYDDIHYYSDSYITPAKNAEKSFSRVTPKVGVAFHLKPDHTIYANLGGGVEAPAGNETDPAGTFGQDTVTAINPLLEPISSTSIELGMKQLMNVGSGFLRAISYDVALYHTNVTNEIVPYRGGRFYFTAARAERMGAEVGTRIATAPGVSFIGALTVADNRYRDYVVDSVHYGRAGATADYSDNKVVGVPDYFYNVGAAYAPPFLRQAEIQLEVQHTGEYFADDANTVTVPGFSVINASLGLKRPIRIGSGINVRGFVRVENLTAKKYVASAFLNPDVVGGVPVAFEPGLPRNFVLSASIGWGR
ncbi:MAG: TonB-dependent receptor [Longimicrobiales bacterium]